MHQHGKGECCNTNSCGSSGGDIQCAVATTSLIHLTSASSTGTSINSNNVVPRSTGISNNITDDDSSYDVVMANSDKMNHQNQTIGTITGTATSTTFSSNTFPLLARSSIKRPLSLTQDRQTDYKKEQNQHQRMKGSVNSKNNELGPFRTRAKTIHSSDSYSSYYLFHNSSHRNSNNRSLFDAKQFTSNDTSSTSSASATSAFEQFRKKTRKDIVGTSISNHHPQSSSLMLSLSNNNNNRNDHNIEVNTEENNIKKITVTTTAAKATTSTTKKSISITSKICHDILDEEMLDVDEEDDHDDVDDVDDDDDDDDDNVDDNATRHQKHSIHSKQLRFDGIPPDPNNPFYTRFDNYNYDKTESKWPNYKRNMTNVTLNDNVKNTATTTTASSINWPQESRMATTSIAPQQQRKISPLLRSVFDDKWKTIHELTSSSISTAPSSSTTGQLKSFDDEKDKINQDNKVNNSDDSNLNDSKLSCDIICNNKNKAIAPHSDDDDSKDEDSKKKAKSITNLKTTATKEPFWSAATASTSIASTSTHIPTEAEKEQFQRSLDSATTLVFHRRSGLPLTSSPAPIRKSGTCFDFDSSLTSVNAIKKALFHKDPDGKDLLPLRSKLSLSAPTATSGLLGNFEESVLNGRLDPASIVNGFTAEIGASGSFCPPHKTYPVTVFFYTLHDADKGEKMSSPYLGHINLGDKGYHVPRQGTVQVTLFNPNGTVVKMFVVRYDLSDMPSNSRTFLRQRTLFMPSVANEKHPESRKWLRYLIHLRFQSSKSGRIRLHTDIRILVFRKHDLDVATMNGGGPYELRSFVQMPSNPKYSKNIKT